MKLLLHDNFITVKVHDSTFITKHFAISACKILALSLVIFKLFSFENYYSFDNIMASTFS